jgi:hypothetical protein
MAAAAKIERTGIPIDVELLSKLRDQWSEIQTRLIERIDADFGVYEGKTFKSDRWTKWLIANDIPWPRLASGNLAMDDDTFRGMARA